MNGSKRVNRRFSLDSAGYHLDFSGISAKSKSNMSSRSSEGRKTPEQTHVDFLEHKSGRSMSIEEGRFDRLDGLIVPNSFKNHNKTFHKYFPDIPQTEDLEHAFTCALQKEVIYHGKMFVSNQHICFHSSVLLKETKVVIEMSSIQTIKKKNMAKFVPNAIAVITTDGHKYLFVSMRNREVCFRLVQSLCPRLQTENISSNLKISSTENHHHNMDIDMMSSQSSLEEITDHLRISPAEDSTSLNEHTLTTQSVHSQTRSTTTPHDNTSRKNSTAEEHNTAVSWVTKVAENIRSVLSTNDTWRINKLLVFYLILVSLLLLSSGYIGMRIVALEEQLSMLGTLPEYTLHNE
ncbi:GRAM domain-containing protein 2B-like [Myxocyprinus asiaticus]|uniref:GRAM domain-containing protein 2B-like n=1 Tax=Myxocyprinus asiaticus TaxID=70543 RepID=UPI0022227FC1|nr:GRAM domain-containing protein 2B-like [Myxocyprinus asiaticus]